MVIWVKCQLLFGGMTNLIIYLFLKKKKKKNWSFIKTTWIFYNQNQILGKKNKVMKPQEGIRYLTQILNKKEIVSYTYLGG
jgi:hypothetical protein